MIKTENLGGRNCRELDKEHKVSSCCWFDFHLVSHLAPAPSRGFSIPIICGCTVLRANGLIDFSQCPFQIVFFSIQPAENNSRECSRRLSISSQRRNRSRSRINMKLEGEIARQRPSPFSTSDTFALWYVISALFNSPKTDSVLIILEILTFYF